MSPIDGLIARESIRELVIRYNSCGDGGRFDDVLDLFAPDATMVFRGIAHRGRDEIATVFTGTRDRLTDAPAPSSIRHFTATHQIDLVDEHHAHGRCYFAAFTSAGLDHWGRYIDEFRVVDRAWRFATRVVGVDGQSASSIFPAVAAER
jgi:hypothetical protein